MAALGAYITALAGLGGLAKKVAQKKNSGTTTNNSGNSGNTNTTTTPKTTTTTASTATTPNITSDKASTLIYSPTGTVQQGYIQDKKTYLNDGTRISDGYSSIDSKGNVWTLENGTGVKKGNINEGYNPSSVANSYYQTALDQQTQYENQMRKLQAQEEAAAEAQAEAQRQQIAANKQSINDTYDDSARQAYITAMQNQKALPALMSTQGLTGGATESSMLNLQANYQNNLADLENARNTALANADLGLNDVNADLANTLASINSSYGAKLADYTKEQQDAAKSDYITNINQYSDDYQAEINKLLAQGVPETDYRIQYLRSARQRKLQQQQEEAEEQAAALAAAATGSSSSSGSSSRRSSGGSSSSGSSSSGSSSSGSGSSGSTSSGLTASTAPSTINGISAIEMNQTLKTLQNSNNADSKTQMRNYIQSLLNKGNITSSRALALIKQYNL